MINDIDLRTKLILILIFCVFAIYLGISHEYFTGTAQESESTSQESKSTSQESKSTSQESKSTSQECVQGSLESCGICKSAFDNYNLYPSTNPFVVRGNDLNTNFKNIITDSVTLSNLGTKNFQVLNNLVSDYNPNDDVLTSEAFNILLQKAPLKVGCCLRKKDDNSQKTVLVRTPLNPNENVDPMYKKFDCKFKSIPIPQDSCPTDYYGGSPNCNAFYDIYSQNIITEFNKQEVQPEYFIKYAPECACYAPKTKVQEIYPDNTPPACYKTSCDVVDNPSTYIDPISRSNPCDITVCNNVFNATIGNVGGNVIIDPKLENTCGKNLPSNTTSDTNTSNTNTSNTDNKTSGSSTDMGSNSNSNSSSSSSSSSIIIIIIVVILFIFMLVGGIYFVTKQ